LSRGKKRRLAFDKILWAGQRLAIYQSLGFCESLPIERGNPLDQVVDEPVQFTVRQTPIDPAVALSGLGIEIIASEYDLESAGPPHELRQTLVGAAAGYFGLPENGTLPAGESQIEGERQFAATSPGPTADRSDADDRRFRDP
jgi:hypothetical protein